MPDEEQSIVLQTKLMELIPQLISQLIEAKDIGAIYGIPVDIYDTNFVINLKFTYILHKNL